MGLKLGQFQAVRCARSAVPRPVWLSHNITFYNVVIVHRHQGCTRLNIRCQNGRLAPERGPGLVGPIDELCALPTTLLAFDWNGFLLLLSRDLSRAHDLSDKWVMVSEVSMAVRGRKRAVKAAANGEDGV